MSIDKLTEPTVMPAARSYSVIVETAPKRLSRNLGIVDTREFNCRLIISDYSERLLLTVPWYVAHAVFVSVIEHHTVLPRHGVMSAHRQTAVGGDLELSIQVQ
jgi:hypothetical protein